MNVDEMVREDMGLLAKVDQEVMFRHRHLVTDRKVQVVHLSHLLSILSLSLPFKSFIALQFFHILHCALHHDTVLWKHGKPSI